jgi:hypothetical protein
MTKLEHFVKIRAVGNTNGTMDTPYRGGHDRYLGAFPAFLYASRVGTAGNDGFVLPADVVFIGNTAELLEQGPVVNG